MTPPRLLARVVLTGTASRSLMAFLTVTFGLSALVWSPSAFATPTRYAASLTPAHSALVSVLPPDKAVLDAGPTELVLTFNEDINPRFTQLALSRADGIIQLNPPTVTGPTLRATLADPGPGAYRLAYRVVSADGHPISGETSFTVRGSAASATSTGVPATTSAQAAPVASVTGSEPTVTAGPGATQTQDGMIWVYLGAGLLVLAAAAGVWETRRKRR